MTDLFPPLDAGLTAALKKSGMVGPTYGGASLATLLPAVASALGVAETLEAWGQLPGGAVRASAAQSAWGIDDSANICVVLVDGLGAHNIREHAKDAPFLDSLLAQGGTASSGFPSTTAASMSQLGTGTSPGKTGMIGYSALSPSTGMVGNFVSWRNMDSPESVQRESVLFESIAQAGIRVTSIGMSHFEDSGMTQAALRGANFVAADSLRDTIASARKAFTDPGLTYTYWGGVDKTGHVYGVGSSQWRRELREFDAGLERLVAAKPEDARIIVTADHGMVNVDFGQRIDIADDYGLSRGVRAVAGEPRCPQIYFNSPKYAQEAHERWVKGLRGKGIVLTRSEVVESGLYGHVAPHVEPWIGDLVVIMAGNWTLVDSSTASKMALGLKGVHGSLTPAEVIVPRIVL